ncbi:hypothetical protein NRB16_18875 [Pseudomonas sp. LJDD11]|uniref:hypothetical protein n=1 Tax=unclassified Pseudomonas TaxID=196821 RepID=UPI001185012D|nr:MULTISPECIES: hypothetical protein [unclassified Pseudomonas]MCQ9425584.1 hypothetical protein [Pseudomonas sp. LJDD11]
MDDLIVERQGNTTMKKTAVQLGDDSLADAFRELMNAVINMREAGVDLNQVQHAPEFTYLLTPKQFDRIKRICREKGWPEPNQRGILMDLQAIAHPLDARETKDHCTSEEALQILVNAYCAYSQVGLNKPKHAQGILFNTGRKVSIGRGSYYALAVVKVCEDGVRRYLAPVTAYHATEAKIRKIR